MVFVKHFAAHKVEAKDEARQAKVGDAQFRIVWFNNSLLRLFWLFVGISG
jgi:hypothetical protein